MKREEGPGSVWSQQSLVKLEYLFPFGLTKTVAILTAAVRNDKPVEVKRFKHEEAAGDVLSLKTRF